MVTEVDQKIFSVNTRKESFRDEMGKRIKHYRKGKGEICLKNEGTRTIKSILTFQKPNQPRS